ncbi:Fis family transcriptional regulator [Kyrpidia spormannii]|uniref:HTH-type transcriptional regulatory protein TyrR n=1 Tax=Kyrpidia spormannii TaxID=2055160 RepID=A0A2K8N3Q9_9BACL|nr:sigma 54-interacting transcriptional regulator [Kyrpidia spormannii]ATY84103.1 Fis family transcriptional regulator [Kyrpidia spormannii]
MTERELLDVLDTPIYFIDAKHVVVWMNRAAQNAVPGIVKGMPWTDVQPRLPRTHIFRFHEVQVGGEPGVMVEGTPSVDPALLSELERLRQANEDLETILDTLFDEVFVTDGEGVVLRVNTAAEQLYGLQNSDIVGRTVFDLEREQVFYPSVAAMVLQRRRRVTALQETKNGHRLVVTGSPVFDREGRIVRIVCYTRDLTSSRSWPSVAVQGVGQGVEIPRDSGLVAENPAMKSVMDLIRRVAPTDATILLLGETGVGKNRLARFIHDLSSRRANPFVEINCANVPESLFESELFGYESGAFTGARKEGKVGKVELAHGGTLFLNEVGELPLHVQGKILDLLQERTVSRVGGVHTRKVDIRIVAATNKDLRQLVKEGRFRDDLYFRLNVVPLTIPPLRERGEDICTLAETLVHHFCDKYQLPRKAIHPDVMACFLHYAWPGNVRELENVIERLCIIVEDDILLPEHLPEELWSSGGTERGEKDGYLGTKGTPDNGGPPPKTVFGSSLPGKAAFQSHSSPDILSQGWGIRQVLEEVERELYARALQQYGSTYAIAKHLRVSQPTVVRKLRQFGLSGGRALDSQ